MKGWLRLPEFIYRIWARGLGLCCLMKGCPACIKHPCYVAIVARNPGRPGRGTGSRVEDRHSKE
jgi:hypothetical protein